MLQNSSFSLMFLHAYFVKTLYDTVMYVVYCSMIAKIVIKCFTGISPVLCRLASAYITCAMRGLCSVAFMNG